DLTGAHRMADQGSVAHVELLDDGGQVVGERVVIVAAAGLAGAAMTAPIVGDAARALRDQRSHLVLPHVGVRGPRMDKNYRRARAPVLLEQGGAVSGLEVRHPENPCGRSAELRAAS